MKEQMAQPLDFIDLKTQRLRLGHKIDDAIARVLAHGQFIMGPEVFQLEQDLATFTRSRHCITCSSGTDALLMALMAWSIGPGDAVFVPSFTFASTAEVVVLLGATPVFVDIELETFNIDPRNLKDAILDIGSKSSLRPAAVIPVDMFGLPAAHEVISGMCEEHGLRMLVDAAQSFGASVNGIPVGTAGDVTTTSFFPAKPLGCYGDGGAIFTDDDETAEALRSIRLHGRGQDKYDNVRIGINGRLDTIQAAILLEKLQILNDEIALRNQVARRYSDGLAGIVNTPHFPPSVTPAWAQYTIRSTERDRLASELKERGIPTAIYYPKPLHLQAAFGGSSQSSRRLPSSERAAAEVLSLPMHPYLDEEAQETIISALVKIT